MTTLLERIADSNNLYWAWNKARNIYRPGDIWFNELEVARFEAELAYELRSISQDFLNGTYALKPIQPIAYPKSPGEKGPRTRQTFWVSVRDQVAWLAVVNVIGSYIDSSMPYWSYGNRLYLTVFYDEDADDRSERKYGYYRNTTRHLFRKWKQSWPLYRQHINLTARLIAKGEKETNKNLEEAEDQILKNNLKLNETHPMQATYLLPGYWGNKRTNKLFWAGIDLEKFYPNISQQAIRDNIRLGLMGTEVTESLFDLIDNLLDFRLDIAGWDKKSLDGIILSQSEEYAHLPTGLFVAGFLANAALLQIDMQVVKLLEGNRDIAHFRFVDDHVILATSFEKLDAWINTYTELLKSANIGAGINLEKTVPKALGAYYDNINSPKPKNPKKFKQAAVKATSLDPDFPNPLMTQTLAKVSRIARTEFNLLTPDEEKSLIADVEHLLVTDFPDHELRKDTRVSFAARMLSTMVPKMMVDNTSLYAHQKEVSLKNIVIHDYEKALPNYTGQKKIDVEAEIAAAKESLNGYKLEVFKETARLLKEEKQLGDRTIKLLLKAVHENHDKVRLWARLLEFYQKSGAGKPTIAVQEISKLIKSKITNDLSATFIHSHVLQVLSALLLDTVKIINNPQYSYKRRKRAQDFVVNSLDPDLFEYFKKKIKQDAMPYEQQSLQLFKCSCGTVIFLCKDHLSKNVKASDDLVRKYGLVNWNNPLAFFKNTGYDAGTWCWWLLDNLPVPAPSKAPLLWAEMTKCLDPHVDVDLNLLLRYPDHIPEAQLAALDTLDNPLLKDNEGVLFDMAKNIQQTLAPYNFLGLVSKKAKTLTDYRTLDQWIDWTRSMQMKQVRNDHYAMRFDPRLGEWTALTIIRQVATELQKRMLLEVGDDEPEIAYFRLIHPNNFRFPTKWIDFPPDPLTWESLADMLEKDGKVEFRSAKNWIVDKRFLPNFGVDTEKQFQGMLIGLGSLLISLLAKNTTLPDKWNPLGQQMAWMGLAKAKLRDVAVSTYTQDIIDGCFSKRNIETLWFKRLQISADFKFDFKDDNKWDPPAFVDIDDFIKYVDLALKKLKIQQLSVSMHQPRQLTPVSLVQLNEEKYQHLLEDEPFDKEKDSI